MPASLTLLPRVDLSAQCVSEADDSDACIRCKLHAINEMSKGAWRASLPAGVALRRNSFFSAHETGTFGMGGKKMKQRRPLLVRLVLHTVALLSLFATTQIAAAQPTPSSCPACYAGLRRA